MISARRSISSLVLVATLAACSGAAAHPAAEAETAAADSAANAWVLTLVDTTLTTEVVATGTAAPLREATLATKLMATVTAVDVVEGSRVRHGQRLLRLDARDLDAKRDQVQANRQAAQAGHAQAVAHEARIRALHAEDAAPQAMLDAAEAQLAQALSALRAADAAAAELAAVESYATIVAPFTGVVTRRLVDPGAMAAPGVPLLIVQDASQLRVTVHVAPAALRSLQAGDRVAVTIEGERATGVVEGVVPAAGGLHAVNAIVENPGSRFPAGGSATLSAPAGTHRGLALPEQALLREGDLVGVTLRSSQGDTRRWVRVRPLTDGLVEVTAGLRAGDRVVLPALGGVE